MNPNFFPKTIVVSSIQLCTRVVGNWVGGWRIVGKSPDVVVGAPPDCDKRGGWHAGCFLRWAVAAVHAGSFLQYAGCRLWSPWLPSTPIVTSCWLVVALWWAAFWGGSCAWHTAALAAFFVISFWVYSNLQID